MWRRDNPVAAGGSVVMGLTACLIIANAIGLQPGRHPAPFFSTRDRADLVQVPEPDGRRTGLKIQEISTLVLDLQNSLRRLGLYEGPLDGLTGPATDRAIRAFERRAGQVETGEATEALLALILMQGNAPLEANIPIPRLKPRFSGTVHTQAEIDVGSDVDSDPTLLKIQKTLSDLGYGPLSVDGLMGTNTAAALKRFELDRGLPITGVPNAKTIERLEMVSGQKLSG